LAAAKMMASARTESSARVGTANCARLTGDGTGIGVCHCRLVRLPGERDGQYRDNG